MRPGLGGGEWPAEISTCLPYQLCLVLYTLNSALAAHTPGSSSLLLTMSCCWVPYRYCQISPLRLITGNAQSSKQGMHSSTSALCSVGFKKI